MFNIPINTDNDFRLWNPEFKKNLFLSTRTIHKIVNNGSNFRVIQKRLNAKLKKNTFISLYNIFRTRQECKINKINKIAQANFGTPCHYTYLLPYGTAIWAKLELWLDIKKGLSIIAKPKHKNVHI